MSLAVTATVKVNRTVQADRCVGRCDEWHVDPAFFLILGKRGNYPASPL